MSVIVLLSNTAILCSSVDEGDDIGLVPVIRVDSAVFYFLRKNPKSLQDLGPVPT